MKKKKPRSRVATKPRMKNAKQSDGDATGTAERELTAADLGEITWNEVAPGLYRIVADLTCARCGAYQAADCDPTSRKDPAIRMTVQLLNAVGWRVYAEQILCPDCANT